MNGLSLMLIESVINQIIESVLHNGKTTEKEHADAYIRSEEALDAERDIMYAIENLNIALDDEEVYEYCF